MPRDRPRRGVKMARIAPQLNLAQARDVVIEYFHQVDDPYSHLLVQLLPRLTERYDVTVRPWLAPPPNDAAAPERERLVAYARRDAVRVGAEYGRSFPSGAAAPSAEAVILAQRALAGRDGGEFAARAVEVGEALWCGDVAALTSLATASVETAAAAVA